MDADTVEIYERNVETYERTRPPRHVERARTLAAAAAAVAHGRPVVDLGCGPGGYLPVLGPAVVGVDAASSMLARARAVAPSAPLVRADLEGLPFRRQALGGGWARNSYLHVAHDRLPMALADAHRAMAVDAPLIVSVLTGSDAGRVAADDLPGRRFWDWRPQRLGDVLVGAGFAVDAVEQQGDTLWADTRRLRTLADTVGPGMRMLCCGLNPSLVAADAGVGYAGRTNRFWPAAVAAGLVTRDRDAVHALAANGVGLTDLCKRATPRSHHLSPVEYVEGRARVERLVAWLRPGVVAFVGLEGYRAAVDRHAAAGVQAQLFGGRPAYVMPSTSGGNAHARLDDLVGHLRAALAVDT